MVGSRILSQRFLNTLVVMCLLLSVLEILKQNIGCTSPIRTDIYSLVQSKVIYGQVHHGYKVVQICGQRMYSGIPDSQQLKSTQSAENYAKEMKAELGTGYLDFQLPDQHYHLIDFGFVTFPCKFTCSSITDGYSSRILLSSMVTAESFRPKLFDFFIDYYVSIGVRPRNILLTVQVSPSTSFLHLKQLLQKIDAKGVYYDIYYGKWSSESLMYHQAHKLFYCSTHMDWIIVADSDEFHEYPGGNVRNFLKKMDKINVNVVNGIFLDRVAENGKLLNLSTNKHLFQQFPLGCRLHLTFNIGTPKKVMAFKGFFRINRGHHRLALCWFWERRGYLHLTPWQSCPPAFTHSIQPFAKRMNVHHFKWLSGQYEATKHKADVWKGTTTGVAYRNVMSHIESCGGICVSSPKLKCSRTSALTR